MANLLEPIKTAAMQAMEASKPAGIYYGTVVSVGPLQIDVEQKMLLEEPFLVLSTLVQDFDVEMTVDHLTEEKGYGSGDYDAFASHLHEYKGRKWFRVHLALLPGEKVMLLREQGGQKYIVLDRVR